MSSRTLLIFTLILSLLCGPQAWTVAPPSVAMPGCAMTTCVNGCCSDMPCCARSAKDNPQPQPARAAQSAGSEFVARLELRALPIFYLPPALERRLAICKEAQAAHTLPRLAATCIQLI